MKQLSRFFFLALAIPGVACLVQAQSIVVDVQASYAGGGANASLSVGDPVNLDLSGSGDQSDSRQLELLLDDPQLVQIVANDLSSFQVIFTPPPGYRMVIDGVERNVVTGTSGGPGSIKVSLTRNRKAVATDSPVGEASSINWLPPTSAFAPYLIYVDFNLGAGANGDPLPPFRLGLQPRTTSSDEMVLPDSPEITGYTAANGGFQFSVPQADVSLQVDPANTGNFDLIFYASGTTNPLVTYHFFLPVPGTWTLEKVFPGATDSYRTTYSGAITSQSPWTKTWTIEDWHTSSSVASRVVVGVRTLQDYSWTESDQFVVNGLYTDTIEVKPSAGSSTVSTRSVSEYNRYVIGFSPDYFYLVIPKQTTEAAGDGNYVTQTLDNPNFENVRGTQTPTGRVRIGSDGATYYPFQLVRTTYDTWLDASPSIGNPGGVYTINTNGSAVTTTLREMDSRWVAFEWPLSIETKLGTTLLSRSTFDRNEASGPGGNLVVTTTRHDYTSDSDHLDTVTKRFRPDVADATLRGRLYSVQPPTGAKQSYAYATGSFTGSLGGGWSADFAIVTLAGATTGGNAVTGGVVPANSAALTFDSLQMLPNKSTRTVEYLQQGRAVHREVWVYASGGGTAPVFNGGDPVAWETLAYTADGRLASRTSSTGSSYTATWVGTHKTRQIDETGLGQDFSYDEMDRVVGIDRDGVGSAPAQHTALEYDADHRIRFRRIGPVGGEQLVTETTYDLGGRVKSLKTPAQGSTSSAGVNTTSFAYTNGGRDVEIDYNAGTSQAAAKFVTSHADGRLADITGSAVVEQHYSYDFDSSNRPRITRKLGPSQLRPAVTISDLLGRPVEQRMNGFGVSGSSKALVTHYEYDPTKGLLTKTYTVEEVSNTHVTADRLLTYDEFGQPKAAGLDLNGNGTLDPLSSDRFETFDTSFVYANSVWWRRTTGNRYFAGGSTTTHASTSDTRLTGLTGMLAQSVDYDTYGNATTQTVVADNSNHVHHVSTVLPDGTTGDRTLLGGLTLSDRSFPDTDPGLTGTPVLSTSYTYDALGRTTYVTDARTGSAQTNYWYGTALPREQYDARSVLVASHAYDGAGRVASTTAPAGEVDYAYTSRGELLEESGTGTHPSRRTYTDYGELKQLKTYRNGLTGAADLTDWTYDDNTGWLTAKIDAAAARDTNGNVTNASGHQVTYSYAFDGTNGYRTVTRTWTRGTTTTSNYSLTTGDLASVSYGDGTATLSFPTHDREGNPTQVQDATGTRTLTYTNGRLVTENLPAWFNSLVLTSDYQSSTSTASNTVAGRYYRLRLGASTDLDHELSISYGYDDFGRVNGVTADYKAQGSRAALNVPAAYTYKTNSSLWETVTQGDFGTTRGFEDYRDVLTSITATHSITGTATTFGYSTNDAGRRSWATQSGMAFGDYVDTGNDATYYRFGYETTGELQSATGYHGTDPVATTSPLPGRGFGFTYDGAGNRKTATVSGTSSQSAETVSYWDGAGGTGSPGGNNLNQTRSRGTLLTRVSGTSDSAAAVTVGGGAAARETAPGRYWDYAWPNRQQSTTATVTATKTGVTTESADVAVLARPATETLAYDADGNLTEDSLWEYEYDAENRLKRMYANPTATGWGAPDRELLFTYDYLGRRVRKVSKLDGSTVTDTKFIYQGWSLVAELDTATNKIVRSYAWGLDLDSSLGGTGGVGGLVLETLHTDTTLTAYHVCSDGNGNVTALVKRDPGQSDDGAIAASYEYGPFGENVRTQTFDAALQAQGQPFRFSTKFTDSETALVYYGLRFYDPSLGRFLNRDPIEEAGGNNLYGFVGNDPVNGYDYLGAWNPVEWVKSLFSSTPSESGPNEGSRDSGSWDANPIPIAVAGDGPEDPSTSSASWGNQPTERQRASSIGGIYRRNEVLSGAPNSGLPSSDSLRDIFTRSRVAPGYPEPDGLNGWLLRHGIVDDGRAALAEAKGRWQGAVDADDTVARMKYFAQYLALLLNGPFPFRSDIQMAMSVSVPGGGVPRTVPIGMNSRQLADAVTRIRMATAAEDAVVGIRGSSVTGISATRGAITMPADYDFFVVSDSLYKEGLAAGARGVDGALRVGATMKYFPELHAAELQLTNQLGLKTTVRIFSSEGFKAVEKGTELLFIK